MPKPTVAEEFMLLRLPQDVDEMLKEEVSDVTPEGVRAIMPYVDECIRIQEARGMTGKARHLSEQRTRLLFQGNRLPKERMETKEEVSQRLCDIVNLLLNLTPKRITLAERKKLAHVAAAGLLLCFRHDIYEFARRILDGAERLRLRIPVEQRKSK